MNYNRRIETNSLSIERFDCRAKGKKAGNCRPFLRRVPIAENHNRCAVEHRTHGGASQVVQTTRKPFGAFGGGEGDFNLAGDDTRVSARLGWQFLEVTHLRKAQNRARNFYR